MTEKNEKLLTLKKLVDTFQRNNEHYSIQGYKEQQLRMDFVDKFFALFDWDVSNEEGVIEEFRDVRIEDNVEIQGNQKNPDYSFRIGNEIVFFVETKKPSVNIKEDIHPAFQLRRYGYTAKRKISILTDFHEFAIYDTSIKPNKNDKASIARLFYCTYEEYEKNWDFLYGLLAKDNVKKGSINNYIGKGTKKGSSEVDKEFLKLIEGWRSELAKNIAINNKKLDIDSLNLAVQKIIDRIIFLRICEEKGIEQYENLHNIACEKSAYEKLVLYFDKANKKYNSELFKSDEYVNQLNIDDDILQDIIKNLYYPECPYAFSVLPVEILGNIYEQFLGKTIRLTDSHQAKIEEKPEVRKAGGVYYTPKYIVDYIVTNTVGEKIKGLSPKDIEKIKILDPACGSGSFLLGAFTSLLSYHLAYYTKKVNLAKSLKNEAIYPYKKDSYRLTIKTKQNILLNNIYGVDIDVQAVEVTKLSLMLKLLEGESDESAGKLFKYSEIKLLPNLSNNIKCGNSLIDFDYFKDKNLSILGNDDMKKVNAFDWNKEFLDIFKAGGFDCVIGNPPYIRIQRLNHSDSDYIFNKYQSPTSKMDLSLVFIEKAIKLMNSMGLGAFICTSQWLFTDYGKNMRKMLSNGKLSHIIDFGSLPVFEKVSTYPAIFILSNKSQKELLYKKIRDISLLNLEGINSIPFSIIPHNTLSEQPWNLGYLSILSILKRNKLKFAPLNQYATAYIGALTGMDSVFVVDDKKRNENKLEGKLLFPYAYRGNEVFSYTEAFQNAYVIYPYKEGPDGRPLLIEEKELSIKAPKIYKYLSQHKNELKQRLDSRKKYAEGKEWFRYLRPGSFKYIHPSKLLVKGIDTKLTVGYLKGETVFNGANSPGIIVNNNINLSDRYLLGILNSKVISYHLRATCPAKMGGYTRFNANNLNNIPIREVNLQNKEDDAFYKSMVSLVDQMIGVQTKMHSSTNKEDNKRFKQKVEILDKQINELVYELYGLTKDEIDVINKGQ